MIALVATLHDPEGALAGLAAPFVAGWLERFREVVIFTGGEGGGPTGRLLAAAGARLVTDDAPQGVDQMGRVRLAALRAAGEHPFYLMMDLDRLIHWERTFPDELRQVERGLPDYDFLVLGRTPRAFESHPHVQRETERLANAAFAATFGETWDITGGQRGLSAAAAAALAQHSRCDTLGVDGAWPILCRHLGLKVGYRPTEGLEFETADRYAHEIARLGYEGWLARYINTPAQWEMRLRIAHQIARATLQAGGSSQ